MRLFIRKILSQFGVVFEFCACLFAIENGERRLSTDEAEWDAHKTTG